MTAQGSGAVEPVSSHAVTLEYDGVLEEISIEPGDMVSKGDILAVYDIESIDDAVDAKKEELDSTDEAIAQMSRSGADTVKAPVAGRVKRIFAHEGGCCCPHHRGKGRTCGAVGGRTYEDGGVHRLFQFMLESVFLSLAGGLIGMGISGLVLFVLGARFPDYRFVIAPDVAALALGFSVTVGLIFGIYPANKAARLSPINALHYE